MKDTKLQIEWGRDGVYHSVEIAVAVDGDVALSVDGREPLHLTVPELVELVKVLQHSATTIKELAQ